jgi:hypothetical protein
VISCLILKVSKLKLYLSRKSLLTPAYRTGRSLCQPEVGALSKGGIRAPSLEKRGKGRFSQCKFYFDTVNIMKFETNKIITLTLIALSLIFFSIGCSSKIDKNKFRELRKAARGIDKAVEDTTLPYGQFEQVLHRAKVNPRHWE